MTSGSRPPTSNGARALRFPFFWAEEVPDDPLAVANDPEAVATIRREFGFAPSVSLCVGAMCRGRPSDRILARLTLALLEQHQGVLLFDGLLAPSFDPVDATGWQAWFSSTREARARAFSEEFPSHPGRLVAVSSEGEPCYHAADRAFVDYWLTHPAFHFVNRLSSSGEGAPFRAPTRPLEDTRRACLTRPGECAPLPGPREALSYPRATAAWQRSAGFALCQGSSALCPPLFVAGLVAR